MSNKPYTGRIAEIRDYEQSPSYRRYGKDFINIPDKLWEKVIMTEDEIDGLKENDIVKDEESGTYFKVSKVASFGSVGTIIRGQEMFKGGMRIEKDLFLSEAMRVTTAEVAEKIMAELNGE